MNQESEAYDRQSKDEVAVFRKFSERLPYHKEIRLIEKKLEPMLDISCTLLDETNRFFELVELIDKPIAKSCYGGSYGGGFSDDDFYLGTLQKKFDKKYPVKCELLAFRNAQPGIAEKSLLPQIRSFIIKNIDKSPFQRVWIYSVHQDEIILVYPSI